MCSSAMGLVCRQLASSPSDIAYNKRPASEVSFLRVSGQVSLHRELSLVQGTVVLKVVATAVICL
jgi:hypothetical protein